MHQNKILKSVTDTWSNVPMIPKGILLNKLPGGEKGWRRQDLSRTKRFYIISVLGREGAGDGTKQEGVKVGSLQPFITLEGDRELRGAEW